MKRTLDLVFNPLKEELYKSIIENNLEKALEVAQNIKNVKVLDPACGSGGFLVKVVRYLFELYEELINKLKTSQSTLFEEYNHQEGKGSP